MQKIRGPVDDSLKSLADFMVQHRGRRLSSLDQTKQKRFKDEVRELLKFVIRTGRFASSDRALLEAVFDDTIDGLRSKIGLLPWIRSTSWLLAMISRGLTPSGKLYVETRQRICALKTTVIGQATTDDTHPLDEKLGRFLFQNAKFEHPACSLRRHKKNKQINAITFCECGCDLQMLQALEFHEITIGRIHGLKRATLANRIFECQKARSAAQRVPDIAKTTTQATS